MALIERLCQVEADETRNIAISPFVNSLYLALDGKHTGAQLKTFWNMTTEDAAEMDTLLIRVNAPGTMAGKMLKIACVDAVLNIWEHPDVNPALYDSVEGIRTALLTNL